MSEVNQEEAKAETADVLATDAAPVSTTDKPVTIEDKKKVWTRRIIGAIVFFGLLGCAMLLLAAQAVSFMFKTILTP